MNERDWYEEARAGGRAMMDEVKRELLHGTQREVKQGRLRGTQRRRGTQPENLNQRVIPPRLSGFARMGLERTHE